MKLQQINAKELDHCAAPVIAPKRRFVSPALIRYGSLNDITRATEAPNKNSDNGSGQANKT
jgi:hypothetical protein